MLYPFYFDSTYILIIIGAILCLLASAKVRSTYSRYQRVRSASGLTGREAAERILYYSGIQDVRVEHVAGNLTDHYDPRSKVLRLSDTTYGSPPWLPSVLPPMSAAMPSSTPGDTPLKFSKRSGASCQFRLHHCLAADHPGISF